MIAAQVSSFWKLLDMLMLSLWFALGVTQQSQFKILSHQLNREFILLISTLLCTSPMIAGESYKNNNLKEFQVHIIHHKELVERSFHWLKSMCESHAGVPIGLTPIVLADVLRCSSVPIERRSLVVRLPNIDFGVGIYRLVIDLRNALNSNRCTVASSVLIFDVATIAIETIDLPFV